MCGVNKVVKWCYQFTEYQSWLTISKLLVDSQTFRQYSYSTRWYDFSTNGYTFLTNLVFLIQQEGNTCLHVAVMHGSIEVVARLHCYAADNHLNEKLTNQVKCYNFITLRVAKQISSRLPFVACQLCNLQRSFLHFQ